MVVVVTMLHQISIVISQLPVSLRPSQLFPFFLAHYCPSFNLFRQFLLPLLFKLQHLLTFLRRRRLWWSRRWSSSIRMQRRDTGERCTRCFVERTEQAGRRRCGRKGRVGPKRPRQLPGPQRRSGGGEASSTALCVNLRATVLAHSNYLNNQVLTY